MQTHRQVYTDPSGTFITFSVLSASIKINLLADIHRSIEIFLTNNYYYLAIKLFLL